MKDHEPVQSTRSNKKTLRRSHSLATNTTPVHLDSDMHDSRYGSRLSFSSDTQVSKFKLKNLAKFKINIFIDNQRIIHFENPFQSLPPTPPREVSPHNSKYKQNYHADEIRTHLDQARLPDGIYNGPSYKGYGDRYRSFIDLQRPDMYWSSRRSSFIDLHQQHQRVTYNYRIILRNYF